MVFSKSTTLALAVLVMVAATSLLSVIDAEEQIIFDGEEQLTTSTDGLMSKKPKACCDSCLCTRSIPPQCQCTDQKKQCYPGCKACRCTRSFPPKCLCMDISNFCYPQCSASAPPPSSSKCSDDCKVCKCTRSFPPICSCADE